MQKAYPQSKMVVLDDMETSEKLKIYDKAVKSPSYDAYGEYLSLRLGNITIPNIKMMEPLRAEAEHFIQCVGSRKEPKTAGRDGLEAINILAAAQQFLNSKGLSVDIVQKRLHFELRRRNVRAAGKNTGRIGVV